MKTNKLASLLLVIYFITSIVMVNPLPAMATQNENIPQIAAADTSAGEETSPATPESSIDLGQDATLTTPATLQTIVEGLEGTSTTPAIPDSVLDIVDQSTGPIPPDLDGPGLSPYTLTGDKKKMAAAKMAATKVKALGTPSLDINSIQQYVNHVSGRRALNQSDRPYLADRNNEDESIEPTNKGSLTLKRSDLKLPGRDGLDLELGRYYSSSQSAIGTRKVCLSCYYLTNQYTYCYEHPEGYGYELYMVDKSGNYTFANLFETQSAAALIGEDKYSREKNWAYYVVQGNGMQAGDKYYSIKYKNYSDSDSYLRNRWDLGVGWSFAFPSIQCRRPEVAWDDTNYLTFYDGNGGAYELNITADQSDSNLSDYQGKDIVVDLCTTLGKSYSNGQESATYAYIEGGQKEYYFTMDGRLIGIKDHKGNEIKFFYMARTIYGQSQQFIRQIVDSVGRTVDFNYVDNPDTSGRIDITVHDPSNTQNLSLSYIKESFQYNYNEYFWTPARDQITGEIMTSRPEPKLAQYLDPEGNTIKYSYENKEVKFWFNSYNESQSFSSVGDTQGRDYQVMLTKIEYPHSNTYFNIQIASKMLGNDSGSYQEWGVNKRYDTEIINNGESAPKNEATYTGLGYYALKLSRRFSALNPNRTYDFNTVRNGITTTQYFNLKGQQANITASDGVRTGQSTCQDWDTRYNLKPVRILKQESDGNSSLVYYIDQSYNDWGGISSYAQGNTTDESTAHTRKYYYNDTANKYLLTRQEYNQSTSTPLNENYQYNNEGRLIKATNANGEESNYSYSTTSEGRIKETTATLEDGKTARSVEVYGPQANNAYPTELRKYYTGAPGGYTSISTSYNMLLGLPATVSDEAGNQSIYSYDRLGRVTSIKLPDVNNYQVENRYSYQPRTTSPLFDSVNQGLLTTLVESTTIYKNKSSGQEQKHNQHQTYYNAYGQMILDAIYDQKQNNWLPLVQYHYDNYGNPIYQTDAAGNTWTYQYNGWGELVSSTDPFGNSYREQTSYRSGWKIISDCFIAAGSSTPEHQFESTYDQYDHLLKNQALPSNISESYQYDAAGNIIQHTDPMTNQYKFTYDPLDRLRQITDPLTQKTDYSYSRLGQLKDLKIYDGADTFTTSWQYDEIGQQTKETDPANISDSTSYNPRGLVENYTDPNGVTFNTIYDSQRRMTSQNGGGIGIQYSYGSHPYGPDSITLNNGNSINYSYDGLGRIASATTTGDGKNNTVSYSYDNTNRPTAVTGPGGQTTGYSYDKTRLSTVQYNSKNIGYEYYPDGLVKTVTYPQLEDGSILKTSYEYDDLNRLTKLTNTKGESILSQYQYTYDSNSNIKTITDANGVTNYNYDSLNRLTQIQRPAGQTINYTYDTRGNRLTAQGDLTATDEAEVNYTFNPLNQLTAVNKNTQTTSYSYDSTGLRTKKTGPSQTTRYIYNSSGSVIAEADQDNNVTSHYIWGPNQLLVKQDPGGEEYYYLYNGHGDVVQIIDKAGNILNHYEYDEWGNILDQIETIDNDFKYCGEIYDDETGLYYLRARYYDPSVGRFISEDSVEGSITNPLSLNLYTYCSNNPIIYTDPTGHWQTGDENLSNETQKAINDATKEYLAAQKRGDKKAMAKAHKKAEDARHNEGAYSDGDKTVTVPKCPDGVSISYNIELMKDRGDKATFYLFVKNGGKWDYKQQGSEYQDLGNYNFGATGATVGFSDETLFRGAGWAQGRAGTSTKEWGNWRGGPPYGDDPHDQFMIQMGINYYRYHY